MATGPTRPERADEQQADEHDWSSVEVTMSEPQTRQFVTLYRALEDFDDRAAQPRIACPRLCFAGSGDEIAYDERWGGVVVRIAAPLVERGAELEQHGWDVRVIDGLDHISGMQAANVLPVLRPWLTSTLRAPERRTAAC
jgi:glutaredoxin-related protein